MKKWYKRIIFIGCFVIGLGLGIDCHIKGLLLGELEVAWAGAFLLAPVTLGLWWKRDKLG